MQRDQKRGCQLTRRTSVVRLVALLMELQRGCSLRESARRLEVSHATVKRDVDTLRDQLGYRVEWNYARERWEIQPPSQRLML